MSPFRPQIRLRPPGRTKRWPGRVRRFLFALLLLAAGLAVVTWLSTDGFAAFGDKAWGARADRLRSSPHFKDGQFVNLEPTGMMKPGENFGVLKEWLFGKELRAPNCPLPLATDTRERLAKPPETGLRITWLGHSTTLLEIDGSVILTDPQWSERASPSTWVGPKRFHPPPLAFADLPKIDAVVISHDHYDHLDMETIRALAARGSAFYVGLGVGAHLERWGVKPDRIVEHDWWEASKLPSGVQVISTPTRHFTGRGPFGANPTLWTSWTIVGPRHRLYYSGDTGMTAGFKEIGERFGPFDVALLEIGQYHPSWGDIHLGPVGALDASAMLKAHRLFPIHWGTFVLGLHGWAEPAETLTVEGQKRGTTLVTPMLGAPIEPNLDQPTPPWWRALPPYAPSCPTGVPASVVSGSNAGAIPTPVEVGAPGAAVAPTAVGVPAVSVPAAPADSGEVGAPTTARVGRPSRTADAGDVPAAPTSGPTQ